MAYIHGEDRGRPIDPVAAMRRREVPLADYDAALADTSGGLDRALVAALRRLPTRQRPADLRCSSAARTT